MTNKKSNLSLIVPVMFTFFIMGFVDMVGTATNYVKADFQLSDTMANFLPSMVFLWFFFLSVPTSLLMNRIGKKKTVLASLAVTVLALVIPLFAYSYPVMLVSFCLLGIGNTLMQVSLNPLITLIVKGDKLASTLTFGQFIKALRRLPGHRGHRHGLSRRHPDRRGPVQGERDLFPGLPETPGRQHCTAVLPGHRQPRGH